MNITQGRPSMVPHSIPADEDELARHDNQNVSDVYMGTMGYASSAFVGFLRLQQANA
jgi:hypothetical protein